MGVKIAKSVIKKQKYLDGILKRKEREKKEAKRHKFQNLIDRLEIKKKEKIEGKEKDISRFIGYVRRIKEMK